MALPAEVGALADLYYNMAATHAATTANAVEQFWRTIPYDMSLIEGWERIREPVLEIAAREQTASALMAAAYLQAQADAQGFELDTVPDVKAFVTPSDTADYWLSYGVTGSLAASNQQGWPEVMARQFGLNLLTRTVGTMMLDAGREATQAGITAVPVIQGYYRKLRTPSCSRCAVLAGEFYEWNEGFLRHPNCDCEHVPAADVDDSLAFDSYAAIESNQITGLSKADRTAILEDNADVNQVINAKRGLRTTDIFGERIQTTTEGTTRRAVAGRRLIAASGTGTRPSGERFFRAANLRLTPREIYKQAGTDRELAARLLYKHGYVL